MDSDLMDTFRSDRGDCHNLSPYRIFSRREWAALRSNTPLTLSVDELDALQGLNEYVSMDEVVDIYLSLSRLLSLYVAASQNLFNVTHAFLGGAGHVKKPYIIGLAGSIAVGKSTMARILRLLLSRWPCHPKVDLVPTDGFLFPNAVLKRANLMDRKGFPESYDLPCLLRFLADVKAGRHRVRTPVYSHLTYDVLPDQFIEVDQPDIVIIEGLNVLQTARLPDDGEVIPFVSDYFDFSIYLHAEEETIRRWYEERFMRLRNTAFRDSSSYFHHYIHLNEDDSIKTANDIWNKINLVNLRKNILPTKQRAKLILSKSSDHCIDTVMLRNL